MQFRELRNGDRFRWKSERNHGTGLVLIKVGWAMVESPEYPGQPIPIVPQELAVDVVKISPHRTTVCDKCGDESNSRPGLVCGRKTGTAVCQGYYRDEANS